MGLFKKKEKNVLLSILLSSFGGMGMTCSPFKSFKKDGEKNTFTSKDEEDGDED